MSTELTRTIKKHIKGTPEWLASHSRAPARGKREFLVDGEEGEFTSRPRPAVDTDALHYTDRVFLVWQGEVHERRLDARLPLTSINLHAGRCSPADERAMTAHMRATLERCVPWVLGALTPRFTTDYVTVGHEGQVRKGADLYFRGLSSTDKAKWAVILVSSDDSGELVRNAIHHEIWHQVEHSLDGEAYAALSKCMSPHAWQHGGRSYGRAINERMARAYASYAIQAEEVTAIGHALPVAHQGPHKLLFDAFAAVFSGEYAREVAARPTRWTDA